MSQSINHITPQQVAKAGVKPEPKFSREMLRPDEGMTLERLLNSVYWVRASFGKEKVPVRFSKMGAPFRLRGTDACPHGYGNGCTCGYWAVRVKSSFGARTMLYWEPETGVVSGLLNVKPAPSRRERQPSSQAPAEAAATTGE